MHINIPKRNASNVYIFVQPKCLLHSFRNERNATKYTRIQEKSHHNTISPPPSPHTRIHRRAHTREPTNKRIKGGFCIIFTSPKNQIRLWCDVNECILSTAAAYIQGGNNTDECESPHRMRYEKSSHMAAQRPSRVILLIGNVATYSYAVLCIYALTIFMFLGNNKYFNSLRALLYTQTYTHTQQQLTIVLRRLFCMHMFRIEPRSNMGKTCRDIHFGIAPMLVHKTVKSFLLKLFTLNLHISYMFCVYKYSKVFKHRTAAANRSHTNKPPHPKCTGIVAAFVVRCVCARNSQ